MQTVRRIDLVHAFINKEVADKLTSGPLVATADKIVALTNEILTEGIVLAEYQGGTLYVNLTSYRIPTIKEVQRMIINYSTYVLPEYKIVELRDIHKDSTTLIY
jgi:hypothetical protein